MPPVLRTPHLDAVLQVRPHHHRVERQDHFPLFASYDSFGATQNTVGFLGCKSTLLAHVKLAYPPLLQVLFSRAMLNPFIPQLVLIVGVALTQVADLPIDLDESHEIHLGPVLKLV